MNFKKGAALALVVVALAGLIGCSSDNEKSKTTVLPEKRKIIIGLDDNYPPIGFRDVNGELIGSDIDLAREAAKRLNMEVEFRPIDWSSKEAELASKKIDLIWNGLTPTPEREKNILFSIPYQITGQVIFVPKDSQIKSVADLAGKIVGTQDGATSIDALAKVPEIENSFKELKKYPDFVSAFLDLKIGRVDAVLGDEIIGRYYTNKMEGEMIVLPDNFGLETDNVGMRLGEIELKEKIDKVLQEMKDDGTAQAIFVKWFGTDISYSEEKMKNI